MKRLAILMGLLVLSCGTSKKATGVDNGLSGNRPDGLTAKIEELPGKNNRSATASNNRKDRPSEFTDTIRIRDIMQYLTSDELRGREAGSEGIELAASYIESYFEDQGVQPYFSSFRDTLENFPLAAYNLVGLVPGNDKELSDQYIIIGAHYDHVGIIGSATQDSIANGANDNASGTATVLEMARYFGRNRTNKRSLLFVLFSAEEKGLLGSAHLAKRLKDEGLNLYTMLNFEMTGVPMTDKDYLLFLSGYELSNLASVCNDYAGENLIGFLEQAKQFQLFRRSDNYPFHQLFNVPSQTYCSFDFTNYDYYHKVEDEAFRMDYVHMVKVINKLLPVVEQIANSKEQEIKYY